MAPRSDSSVLTTFSSNGWSSAGVACLVGISAPIGDLIGADSSVHLSEVGAISTGPCVMDVLTRPYLTYPGTEECILDPPTFDDSNCRDELPPRLHYH
jgi:hypothetical protein